MLEAAFWGLVTAGSLWVGAALAVFARPRERWIGLAMAFGSGALIAAVDEADVIGDVACALLDRGLRDRPGALRLVGVGVSGLSSYRQLTLDG